MFHSNKTNSHQTASAKTFNTIRLREFSRLKYHDPAKVLHELRQIEHSIQNAIIEDDVRTLRTNSLKPSREAREAALFCYGMSQRAQTPIYFARCEQQDYDFVATWVEMDTQHFAPVQLKELVPQERNQEANLEGILIELSRYQCSSDLTVAIHLNQSGRFDPADVKIPDLRFAGLWMFATIVEDQSQWALWGDFCCADPIGTRFDYPCAASASMPSDQS